MRGNEQGLKKVATPATTANSRGLNVTVVGANPLRKNKKAP